MIGLVLNNRYEIVEQVGSGGMAIVYKAKCRVLNRFVALKVLRTEFAKDEEFIERFRVEAQAAASLSHPNIVSIYDVGEYNGLNYIVMEYVDGITLKEYISRQKLLPWREAVDFSIQICRAVEHAHKNKIVHRDIKPHNIIVTNDKILKVTDFGIARAATASTVTVSDATIGSVHYFSPEQARGGYTDEKSDIYSLGIVMYEMLTGRTPFDGETPIAIAMMHLQEEPVSPKEYNISIPLEVADIVMTAITKDQSLRYQTAGQLFQDLVKVSRGEGTDTARERKSPGVSADTIKIPSLKAEDETIYYTKSNNFDENDLLYSKDDYSYVKDKKEEEEHKNKPGKSDSAENSAKPAPKGDSRGIMALSITSAIIVVLVFAFAVTKVIMPDLFTFASSVEDVPKIVGMNIDEARETLKSTNFSIEVAQRTNSDDAEENEIISQEPSAGRRVSKGTAIQVVVSQGPKKYILEDFKEKEERYAAIKLNDLGIKYKVEREGSDTVPENYITRTEPKAGEEITYNTVVTIYLSSGIQEKIILMPNVTGVPLEQAKKMLAQYKLVLGNIKEVPSSQEKGQVVSQSVEKDKKVIEYSEIDLEVSSGSEEVPSEKPSASPSPSATTSGLKSKTLNVIVPSDKESTNIKVLADGVELHNKEHKSSEGSFNLVVKGIDSVKVDIYYDGRLVLSNSVEL